MPSYCIHFQTYLESAQVAVLKNEHGLAGRVWGRLLSVRHVRDGGAGAARMSKCGNNGWVAQVSHNGSLAGHTISHDPDVCRILYHLGNVWSSRTTPAASCCSGHGRLITEE